VGKDFHSEELTFLRRRRAGKRAVAKTRENLRATRLYPSRCCRRKTRARKARAAFGKEFITIKGALGISNETRVDDGIERRIASNIPPAETFRAVANSSSSLSALLPLLTKTGMAKGNRGQRLRSARGVLALNARSFYSFNSEIDSTQRAKNQKSRDNSRR
jgi:hypothetical protein